MSWIDNVKKRLKPSAEVEGDAQPQAKVESARSDKPALNQPRPRSEKLLSRYPNSSPEPTLPPAVVPTSESLSDMDARLLSASSGFEVAQWLYDLTYSLIAESGKKYLSILLSPPRHIKEPEAPANIPQAPKLPPSFFRWKASTQLQTLSVRAHQNVIEVFLIPREEVVYSAYSEFGGRQKARIELITHNSQPHWMFEGQRLNKERADQLMAGLLKSMARHENQFAPAKLFTAEAAPPEKGYSNAEKWLQEKQNLIHKIINQQEEIKTRLARDLHDTVIADLMMLKRFLSGDKKLTVEENIEILDEIIAEVRDLCNEFAPRHLQDWGLATAVQGLLERLEERRGIKTELETSGDLPSFPEYVNVNLFRIIQECLNNIEKHAGATRVAISLRMIDAHCLLLTVTDNGKGFDPQNKPASSSTTSGSGGFGLGGMEERTELIGAFYPAKLTVTSEPGKGTKVELRLKLP